MPILRSALLAGRLHRGVFSSASADGPGIVTACLCSSSSLWGATSARAIHSSSASPAEASPAKDVEDPDVARAARDLGLDRVSLSQLEGFMDDARYKTKEEKELMATYLSQPNKKRLTYAEMKAAPELSTMFVNADFPKEPVYDASEWVNSNYSRYGYAARSPHYVWQEWVAQVLPAAAAGTYLALGELMRHEESRAGVVKQAQHELARLWDWQHRRVALGLPPDLPPTTTTTTSSSSRAASAAEGTEHDGSSSAAAASAAAADDDRHGSDGGSDDGPPPPVGSARQQADELRRINELLRAQRSGAIRFRDIREGQILKRVYTPEYLEDDMFLPNYPSLVETNTSATRTSSSSSSSSSSTAKLQPLDPEEVAEQARATAAAAVSGFGAGDGGSDTVVTWSSMALLDDAQLKQQLLDRLVKEVAQKYRRPSKFSLTDDGYVFDLGIRPPTPTFDLLTDYLEVKYADVLLRKDAVRTLERRLHAAKLMAAGEAGEVPPAAISAPPQLSAAEREGVTANLDEMFAAGGKDGFRGYRNAVQQLYSEGLITWGELEACWAAAEARQLEEMAVAAEKRMDVAPSEKDRDELFDLLTGQQQLLPPLELTGEVRDEQQQQQQQQQGEREAVARAVWEAAADKVHATAATASLGQPISFDQARGHWQQLLQLATVNAPPGTNFPTFEELLLASSSSSSSSGRPSQELQQQLKQLQRVIQQLGLKPPHIAAAVAAQEEATAASATATAAAGSDATDATPTATAMNASGSGSKAAAAEGLVAGVGSSRSSSVEEEHEAHQQQQQGVQAVAAAAAAAAPTASPGPSSSSSSNSSSSSSMGVEDLVKALVAVASGQTTISGGVAGGLTVEQLLRAHWEQLSRTHLNKTPKWRGPAWEEMWRLMKQLASSPSPSSSSTMAAAAAVTDDDDRGSLQPSSAAAGAGEGWVLDVASLQDKYLEEMGVTPITPAPYPGARRLLRWSQRFVLHAAAGSETHPSESKVYLAVNMWELGQEVGLGREALRHLMAVAGPRYRPKSRELVLTCDRYPTREENRRWCWEVLQKMIAEGHSWQQQQQGMQQG